VGWQCGRCPRLRWRWRRRRLDAARARSPAPRGAARPPLPRRVRPDGQKVPSAPARHAGRGREPAGPPARPITDRREPADTRRGETGAAGSPGSRGRSSDNPRGPSPHREPARALHLLRPALVPRLVPGRPAAPAPSRIAPPHGPGQIAAAAARPSSATAKIKSTAGPEAAPAAAGLSARFPHRPSCCWYRAGPLPVADPADEPVDGAGAGPLDAAASWGTGAVGRGGRSTWFRRRCLRRAPGRSVWFGKFESPVPLCSGLQGSLSGVGLGTGVVEGCLPAGARPVCWCEDGQVAAAVGPGCRYSAL
jgi:hypothetical protein